MSISQKREPFHVFGCCSIAWLFKIANEALSLPSPCCLCHWHGLTIVWLIHSEIHLLVNKRGKKCSRLMNLNRTSQVVPLTMA
jgi:hypothetical protein